MNVTRCNKNPLIEPKDVKPSREDFKVDGVFNCGVTKYNDEIILLCRIAESVKCDDENLEGEFVKVKITNVQDYDLIGERI